SPPRNACLESADESRTRQNQLGVRSQSGSPKVRVQKEIFHTVKELVSVRRALYAVKAITLTLMLAAVQSSAQTSSSADRGPVLINLFRPVYPPLALTARISGNVELIVTVRPDGSLNSVRVINGQQLLREVALESAQRSRYACTGCSQAVTSSTLIYTFQLGPTIYCTTTPVKANKEPEPAEQFPQIIQSQNHVTVVDRPVGTCDVAPDRVKVRSANCLFLWKCGVR
ncbi:MAG: energy transducer TonB, partial [Acidobacteriia bacterium]|nr:energy transducer TonB [Terriglobia bacterium]